jgi:hypothetical protein
MSGIAPVVVEDIAAEEKDEPRIEQKVGAGRGGPKPRVWRLREGDSIDWRALIVTLTHLNRIVPYPGLATGAIDQAQRLVLRRRTPIGLAGELQNRLQALERLRDSRI